MKPINWFVLTLVLALSYTLHSQDTEDNTLTEKDVDITVGGKVERNKDAEKELKDLFNGFSKKVKEWNQKEEDIPIESIIRYFKKLKAFVQKYPSASSALTAKLIITNLGINYTLAEDKERAPVYKRCRKLAEDIAKSYPGLWQGKYALYLVAGYYSLDGTMSEKERYGKALELFEKNVDEFKKLDGEKDMEFRMLFEDDIGRRSEKMSGDVSLGVAALYKLLNKIEQSKEVLKKVKNDYAENPKILLSVKQLLDTIEYEEALEKKKKEEGDKKK